MISIRGIPEIGRKRTRGAGFPVLTIETEKTGAQPLSAHAETVGSNTDLVLRERFQQDAAGPEFATRQAVVRDERNPAIYGSLDSCV